MSKIPVFRKFPNEEFREIVMHENHKLNYAVSNKGRIISYATSMVNPRVLNGSYRDGYKVINYKIIIDGVAHNFHHFLYKMVAETFLPKTSEDQKFVLHLDYVRDNDDIRNLRWATREEMLAHSAVSPHVIAAKKKFIEGRFGADAVAKLDTTKVMHIKKLLANPNRTTRKKMIAKQFGVTVMQIRRIETGENWGHVQI